MSDICQQSTGDETLGLWIFGAMSSLGLCIGYLVAAIDWKYFVGNFIDMTTEQIALGLLVILLFKTLPTTMFAAKEDVQAGYENMASDDANEEQSIHLPFYLRCLFHLIKPIQSFTSAPMVLKKICLVDFFCWIGIFGYEHYATDFFTIVVYGEHSDHSSGQFDKGVHYGSVGLLLHSSVGG